MGLWNLWRIWSWLLQIHCFQLCCSSHLQTSCCQLCYSSHLQTSYFCPSCCQLCCPSYCHYCYCCSSCCQLCCPSYCHWLCWYCQTRYFQLCWLWIWTSLLSYPNYFVKTKIKISLFHSIIVSSRIKCHFNHNSNLFMEGQHKKSK